MTDAPHIPVMLNEVLAALQPTANEVYVDGTLGAGGYTRGILNADKNCKVIGIDRDQTAHDLASQWGADYAGRLTLVKNSFGNLEEALSEIGVESVDGLVLDLGVSSMQFDEADRGFSFRFDAPLDMRMDRNTGETAADIVNGMAEEELANLIYLYGEERKSRHVASAIIKARAVSKITTTKQLADIIRSVIHVSPRDKIDPSTRTFQALRIAVNDELGELESVLSAAERVLKVGGRLVVVTFHSLEDRIVKNFLNEKARPAPSPSRHLPMALDAPLNRLSFSLITKKPVLPTESEMKINPRARSAKLRSAIKLGDS
ncbi:MAG: 16S rRNA (cytosine(1402)-N(4))-methyltransferase [Alphaproteobacteria bacterium RIFCSPHIGHO2_02_FULL_46_13]|nr:MAG: 16S rRNA (cytosine(1402)-N(4))-methyltransferase [Alphaproteobacteria bacterium RIFCSPHIGHO2_02_FULL_46_13]